VTENYPGAPPAGTPPTETSKTDTAREEARSVGQDAKQGGEHVVETAKQESKQVVEEARSQARNLWDQTRSELSDQAGQQQQRAAGGLRSLGDELASMARSSDQNGLGTDLAQRAGEQARRLADYLEQRDPGSLLDEVRGFARRKPGTFLAIAAGLGVLGGRMSRGMMPQHDDAASSGVQRSTQPTANARDTTSRAPYSPTVGEGSVAGAAGAPSYPTPAGEPS
jgi:hypothetical protein